jgi:putative membrane protein
MMTYAGDGRDWTMHDGMGWGGWLMMSMFLLLCFAVLGVLVYVLTRASTTSPGPGAGGPDRRPRSAAEATLDERFARGEIDEPEYEQRRRALRDG